MQSTAQVSAGVFEDQKSFSWAWLDANLRVVKCRGQLLQPFGAGVGSFLSRDPFAHALGDILQLQDKDYSNSFGPPPLAVRSTLPMWGDCTMTFAWYRDVHRYFVIVQNGASEASAEDILFDYLSFGEISSAASVSKPHNSSRDHNEIKNSKERALNETETLISAAAHDLRSPLRAIQNFANWSLEDVPEGVPRDVVEYLRQIDRHAHRASQLVTDMQHYATVERTQDDVSELDLGRLMNEAVACVQNPNNFRVQVNSDQPKVMAPKSAIHILLVQLLDNAIKHHDGKDGIITLRARAMGEQVSIEVADDGPGIEAEHQQKIFNPFQKLESYDDVAGSGLGLAIVRKISNMYNASIQVISPLENGRGTIFRVLWPKHAL